LGRAGALPVNSQSLKLGTNSKVTNAIQDMQKYFVRAKPIPMTAFSSAMMVAFFRAARVLLFTQTVHTL
jgi:hypothetical protein